MEWIIVLMLILLGLVLVIAEIIFIPGTTITGILGGLLTIAGIYFSFDFFGDSIGSIVTSISVFIASISIYYSFSAKTWDKFALHDTSDKPQTVENKLSIGQIGMSKTDLRPMGTGIFNNNFVEVTAFHGYIKVGNKIRIIKIDGNKIFVEQVAIEY